MFGVYKIFNFLLLKYDELVLSMFFIYLNAIKLVQINLICFFFYKVLEDVLLKMLKLLFRNALP